MEHGRGHVQDMDDMEGDVSPLRLLHCMPQRLETGLGPIDPDHDRADLR
jgi:hypothetical protein